MTASSGVICSIPIRCAIGINSTCKFQYIAFLKFEYPFLKKKGEKVDVRSPSLISIIAIMINQDTSKADWHKAR
jgi:hypothetical protein